MHLKFEFNTQIWIFFSEIYISTWIDFKAEKYLNNSQEAHPSRNSKIGFLVPTGTKILGRKWFQSNNCSQMPQNFFFLHLWDGKSKGIYIL